MLTFDVEDRRFNCRSVAVVVHENHLLIHKALSDDFWALPGGRVEFFESSDDTVVREIHEELAEDVHVVRLLWHVENFFNYGGKQFHEIANYFLTEFTSPPAFESEVDFDGIETDIDLIFRWVPLSKLCDYTLKPSFLINAVQDLPTQTQYIKFNEMTGANRK